MKFPDLLSMSLNNLKRRKLRTFLTVLGVVVGTAAIVVMVSLGIGMKELNRELIESYVSLTSIDVSVDMYSESSTARKDPSYLTDDAIRQFAGMDHVTSVYPMLECYVMIRQGIYEGSFNLTGVPREYLEQIPLGQGQLPPPGSKELELVFGNMVIEWFENTRTKRGYWETGELPEIDYLGSPMFVIFDVDQYYQAQYEEGAKMPKKYLLNTAGVVAGTIDDYNEYSYSVYTELEPLKTQLQKIFKKRPIPGQPTNKKGKPYPYIIYSRAVVNVDKIENVTEVQNRIANEGFQAYSNVDWLEQSQQQSGIIQAVLGGIGAISLFVAAIGIANTMMMSIYERTREIGIIKVLGCDMKAIRNMFLLESGFIGLMGGIVGTLVSLSVSALMNRFLNLGQTMTGMEGDISRIPPGLALAAIGFAVMVGMMAGFFPALRAMKLSPLAAIRNE